MLSRAGYSLMGVLLILSTAWAQAQVLVTPELQAWAGYDSNRFGTSDNEEADGYYEVMPALQLSWFASDTLEWRARAQHRQREYLSSSNGQFHATSGEAGVSWLSGAWNAEVFAGGGAFKDSERPDDDVQWLQAAPSLMYTFDNGTALSLGGLVRRDDYDSRLTYEGEAESGEYFSLRPGLQWPLSLTWSAWGEAYAETFTANEAVDEYSGYGLTLGVDGEVTPLLRISGQAWYGVRDYPNGLPEVIESRTDHPLGMEVSLRYRLTDWLTWQTTGSWAQPTSTDGTSEYEQWTVQTGLIIAQDYSLAP